MSLDAKRCPMLIADLAAEARYLRETPFRNPAVMAEKFQECADALRDALELLRECNYALLHAGHCSEEKHAVLDKLERAGI